MIKQSDGNMYPWVSHMHTHIYGKCGHNCPYCYVQEMAARFPNMRRIYSGLSRLDESQLKEDYSSPTILKQARAKGFDQPVIFIEHMGDLFEDSIPRSWIGDILSHCREHSQCRYVFQTKNPERAQRWIDDVFISHSDIIGTTVETNRKVDGCTAPSAQNRLEAMCYIRKENPSMQTFITIEPIMAFDIDVLLPRIIWARPSFVNIGANSKRKTLPEPTGDQVRALIAGLQAAGIEIRQKTNLERLLTL